MKVRILTNITGPTIDYRFGDVATLTTAAGNDLVTAGQAIPEGPSLVDTIATEYESAGYIPLTPNPSGYIGPSGYIADIPAGQFGYYTDTNPDVITVVFPGRHEVKFDVLKTRIPAWR